jgi:putative tricarboxylic transport membrane protein
MIGMVLGPLAETNVRDGLLSSGGDILFVSSPLAVGLYVVFVCVIGFIVFGLIRSLRPAQTTFQTTADTVYETTGSDRSKRRAQSQQIDFSSGYSA